MTNLGNSIDKALLFMYELSAPALVEHLVVCLLQGLAGCMRSRQ